MGYAEDRGEYWRARYKGPEGTYETVKDEYGQTVRFRSRREAKVAADDAEAEVRKGLRRKRKSSRITFGEYANDWYAIQDLALSTMNNYKRHLEEHLLPAFQDLGIADIGKKEVADWKRNERALDYKETSIKTWGSLLHLILSDAVEEGLCEFNPAARRRGRGKRAGRSRNRSPEKTITDALGLLLIAERASLLSGRDEEFIAIITKAYTGLRLGELVGLEVEYVRGDELRVEWQLHEIDGVLHRIPPKDDSYRTLDLPGWLAGLLLDHITQTKPVACQCHGRRYVFSGHRPANRAAQQPGPKLVDVARRAGVSTGTVSNVLNRPESVPAATRERVLAAVGDLGYVRGVQARELAAHHRRSGFATWLFQPAVTGCYPKRASSGGQPVPVLADPFPGIPVRGRGASRRADACWLPIAEGMTPHSARHWQKTMMQKLRTPQKLQDERMGHEDGSVQARYSHVLEEMRRELMEGLTQIWLAALAERYAMCPTSPVPVLDKLLRSLDEIS